LRFYSVQCNAWKVLGNQTKERGEEMKYETREKILLDEDASRIKTIPEKLKKQLVKLTKIVHLVDSSLLFEPNMTPVHEGDIFVIQVQKDRYIYGKVLTTDVRLVVEPNHPKPTCVVLIYRYCGSVVAISQFILNFDRLLLRPTLTTDALFHSGYAKIIGNIPISNIEKNLDLGFFSGYVDTVVDFDPDQYAELIQKADLAIVKEYLLNAKQVNKSITYVDLNNQILNRIPKYCGYLETKGMDIAFEIAQELILDPTITGQKYELPEPAKTNSNKAFRPTNKVLEIEAIASEMIAFHSSFDHASKSITKAIKAFLKESYRFYDEATMSADERSYLAAVKTYVLAINAINESVDHELIETEEREQIYSFIELVSKRKGYAFEYDITEADREW
jgi:hypothetical protein